MGLPLFNAHAARPGRIPIGYQSHADLIATNAAQGLLADLRRARGDDDPPDLAA